MAAIAETAASAPRRTLRDRALVRDWLYVVLAGVVMGGGAPRMTGWGL